MSTKVWNKDFLKISIPGMFLKLWPFSTEQDNLLLD